MVNAERTSMPELNGSNERGERRKRIRETGSWDALQRGLEGARGAVHRVASKVEQLTAPADEATEPSDGGDHRIARWADFKTVIFDDDREFVRFTEYVYDRFGGRGLMLTNVPIPRTARLSPWLFGQVSDHFAIREVKRRDIEQPRRRFKDRPPFDPATIDHFFEPLADLDPEMI